MPVQFQCRITDCLKARREWALTCPDCWQKVPTDMKETLRSYQHGTAGRRAAVRRILEWFKESQRTLW